MSDKALLKQAREAVKIKDFKTSLRLCKQILRSDKENYMALVLLGASLQEAGPAEQALPAFRKATSLNSENPLAWQGLVSHIEKHHGNKKEALDELLNAYDHLLILHPTCDKQKFNEVCEKVGSLGLQPEHFKVSTDILHRASKCGDENKQRCALTALLPLLSKQSSLDDDSTNLLEETLKTALKDKDLIDRELFRQYIRLLLKRNKLDCLKEAAKDMHARYSDDPYPLEWLVRLDIETTFSDKSYAPAQNYIDALKNAAPLSPLLKLAEGIQHLQGGRPVEARKAVEATGDDRPLTWAVKAYIESRLWCWQEAVNAADRACPTYNLQPVLIDSLSRCEDNIELLQRAVEICKKNDMCNTEGYARALVALDQIKEVESVVDCLEEHEALFIKAKIAKRLGNKDTAIEILLGIMEKERSAEVWLELGRGLEDLLEAARADPLCWIAFNSLGKHYMSIGATDKARRCFQRAMILAPHAEPPAAGLIAALRLLGRMGEATGVLEEIVGQETVPTIKSRWAWLQLGLVKLDRGLPDQAIHWLRGAARFKVDDPQVWKALADAYAARGAYQTALAGYARASALEKCAYSTLGSASVLLKLQRYQEAADTFTEAISEDSYSSAMALRGLSEARLQLARTSYGPGGIQDNVQCAVDAAIKSLELKPDWLGTWKLLTDALLLVLKLPESRCFLDVGTGLMQNILGKTQNKIDKEDIFMIAKKCYQCMLALATEQNDANVWHDIAVLYLEHSISNKKEAKLLLERALSAAKKSLEKTPLQWKTWNLLGVIATKLERYALAQHSFIRSLQINENATEPWTGLGALYYILGDDRLSNKAFSRAQRSDPIGATGAWAGQSLVAERLQINEEAADLARHAALMEHPTAAKSAARWALEGACDLTLALDVLERCLNVAVWCTASEMMDLGALQERAGFKQCALKSYVRALEILNEEGSCNTKFQDAAYCNIARTLASIGDHETASQMYERVTTASFNAGCGLALSKFRSGDLETAKAAYVAALDWLAPDDESKAQVLVALTALCGDSESKGYIMQAVSVCNGSVWALQAAAAFGLLHKEQVLVDLVVKELMEISESEVECQSDVLRLLMLAKLIDGKHDDAIKIGLSAIHRRPWLSRLWLELARTALRIPKKRDVAFKCAKSSIVIAQDPEVLYQAHCISGLQELRDAQAVVHTYPYRPDGWALLASQGKNATWRKNALIRANYCAQYAHESQSIELSAWLQKTV